MRADDDTGARRNRSDGKGLWMINVLVGALVAVLSLYVFRADETRDEADAMLANLAALSGQVAAPPAMAEPRAD